MVDDSAPAPVFKLFIKTMREIQALLKRYYLPFVNLTAGRMT